MMINRLKIFLLILFAISCSNENKSYENIVVSIIKEKNNRNYNSIEKGLLDQVGLNKLNVQFNFYTLNDDELSTIEVANNVRNDNSNIAIIIGENATLLSMNIIVPQSIIFAGCFDNLSLSNIYRSKIQNNNITGVYAELDVIKYINRISNNETKSLAYLYTKNLRTSIYMSDYIKRYCSNENIEYYPLEIEANNNSYDIENSIKSKKIDYLLLANDNYIDNNIYSISYICEKYSIPMINSDIEDALNVSILFSLDFNYYSLGRELALLLDKVIKNNGKTENIDFVKLENPYKILINEDIAENYDIEFTDEILEKSSLIIKDGNIIRK